MFDARKRTVVDRNRSAGRTAVDQQRVSTAIGPGEGQRPFRTGDKLRRDIAAGHLQHAGATLQHIEA